MLVALRNRPRGVAPRGGWGGPIALVTVGAGVAALTALPAIGSDGPTTVAQAQVGLDLDAARTSASGRIGTASRESLDAWDEMPAFGSTDGTLTEGFGVATLIADAATLAPSGPIGSSGGAASDATSLAANGIPEHTLRAYQAAAAALANADPTCRLDWTLLAGIGRVESNHGRFAGAIVSTAGVSIPAVIGIRLDGTAPKTAVIVDSDGGRLDGDAAYDRAVGPMQFLPGSWVAFGADGDGDGVRNPQDIDDAALAAGAFLCSGAVDLSTVQGASAAVRRYNNSGEYVTLVLTLAEAYRNGFPVGAIPVVAPVGSVPVQPTTPVQPAAPGVVLGLPTGDAAPAAATDPSSVVAAGGDSTGPDGAATGTPPTGADATAPAATTSPTSSGTPDGPTTPTRQPTATTGTATGSGGTTGSTGTTGTASTTPTGSPTGGTGTTTPTSSSITAPTTATPTTATPTTATPTTATPTPTTAAPIPVVPPSGPSTTSSPTGTSPTAPPVSDPGTTVTP